MSGLCLTRKKGSKLKIGDNVIITIIDISYGQVKILIEAPNLHVDRLDKDGKRERRKTL